MYLNIQLSDVVTAKINAAISAKIEEALNKIFEDEELIEDLVLQAAKGQVKSNTTIMLQSQDFRAKIQQKIAPIIYTKLGILPQE